MVAPVASPPSDCWRPIAWIRPSIGRVHSSSAIAKEADRQAREEVQRHGGVYEAETYAMVAQTLVDRAKERGIELQVSEDLIRFLMKNEAIREGHGQYHEFGIAGLDKLIQAFVSRS